MRIFAPAHVDLQRVAMSPPNCRSDTYRSGREDSIRRQSARSPTLLSRSSAVTVRYGTYAFLFGEKRRAKFERLSHDPGEERTSFPGPNRHVRVVPGSTTAASTLYPVLERCHVRLPPLPYGAKMTTSYMYRVRRRSYERLSCARKASVLPRTVAQKSLSTTRFQPTQGVTLWRKCGKASCDLLFVVWAQVEVCVGLEIDVARLWG